MRRKKKRRTRKRKRKKKRTILVKKKMYKLYNWKMKINIIKKMNKKINNNNLHNNKMI